MISHCDRGILQLCSECQFCKIKQQLGWLFWKSWRHEYISGAYAEGSCIIRIRYIKEGVGFTLSWGVMDTSGNPVPG